MLHAHPCNAQIVGQILQTTLQASPNPHHQLDIIESRKEDVKQMEEISLVGRKGLVGQQFKQIAKIKDRVEGNPSDSRY